MRRAVVVSVAVAASITAWLGGGCKSPPPAKPLPDLAETPPVGELPAPAPAPAARPPALPPEPEVPVCKASLAAAKAQREALLGAAAARAADTLETFNELTRFVANAAAMSSLLAAVHPDAKLRDAARACEQEVQTFVSALLLDRRIYGAIVAADTSKLDAAGKRFVAVTLRDYRRAGVTLDDAARARVLAIDEETTKVGQQIQKNIDEDTRAIEITDPKRLAGLPADWIAAHPAVAGKIRVTTDYPDYIPFITYADDDALRKELYIKFRSRGDRGTGENTGESNEALIGRLLALRAEKAKLLGFKDWADYQSDDKMLRGGKAAAQFIERIAALARPRAARDYAELLAQAKAQDPKATAVADWQKAYLETKVKKAKYAVDATEVRKYFVYDKVLAGLLDITSQIYDVTYQPATDPRTWHPEVAVYDVTRKGQKLGRIFLDMHPRPDKYKHAAQFSVQDGVLGKQLPEGALVCNFPRPDPASGAPALMEHGDVVTMFHEFGHLLHHVLGGHQRWVRQSGVATEHDFVEAPSQMFEEWGWSHETLARFARHHETGAVIPKELVAKMRRAEKFGLGLQTLQQMFYAAISLGFHQADPAKLDQLAMVKALQKQYTPFAYVEGTKFHTSFGHLVGYSSMYYTYMWSLVIAKDLLTPFEKTGLLATDVTYRYRDAILVAGGTKDAADLVKDFLGRKYDFKAFERYLSTD
ncbi:MAG TPA: M3 family metallopeptidase [Kofleriaceae bacterium]|nr:M3 family metallopeptidase [Kofleriaceae bacterium]